MLRTMRLSVLLVTLVGCVGCDQATKSLARLALPAGESISLFHGVLRVERVENPGAFLSLGGHLAPGLRELLFTVGGALLVAAVLVWALCVRRPRIGQLIGAACVCGGGLGNLIDRVAHHGYVTDFLNLGVGGLRTGIFNLADVALLLGMGLLLTAGAARRDAGPQASVPPPLSTLGPRRHAN